MKHSIKLKIVSIFLVQFFLLRYSYVFSENIENQKNETGAFCDKADLIDILTNSPGELLEKENEEINSHDEKLKEEIFNIISTSYKEVIDLTALYFCGVISSDKLYSQMIILLNKDFFKIIKLFSWYIPALLQDEKVSTFIKVKRAFYVTSVIALFLYISREYFQDKEIHRGVKIDDDSVFMQPRQRPR